MTKVSATTKNIVAILAAVALVAGFSIAFAKPAKADQISDLQAQVNALMAQISGMHNTSSSMMSSSCYTFTQSLKTGSKGGEVMWVQKFLNGHGYAVASTGAGSAGNETSTFGPATKRAVMKFQAANTVSPVSGNWFALTRGAANHICASSMTPGTGTGTTTTGTTPTGTSLNVGVVNQPVNGLAVPSAARVPFTTFTLTNTSSAAVTVNSVNVMRTGPANDAIFTGGGVVLIDEMGNQLGVQRTLNSDHTVAAGDPFMINPGQTKTITVAGNMSNQANMATYAGQVVGLTVTGINTTATVAGSLPITGAMHTVNGSLVIGSVTTAISSFDPNGAQSKNIGDTGVRFSGLRFTAGSAEDIKLFSVRFRLNGSISSSDLSNVMVNANGTSSPVTVSSDGRYYTANFPGGILVQKGFSTDVYLMGDITGSNASGRVVEFDVDKTTDVYFVGQSFGYGIQAVIGTNALSVAATHGTTITTSQPWFQGSTVSVTGASITTIGKANEVAAQNIAVNVPNQALGGFATDLKGEALNVQGMVFSYVALPSFASTTISTITNVSIVNENGAVVAGPVDALATAGTISFNNSVTFPVGRHVYTIKGKLPATAPNGATIQLSTTPSAWTGVTGQTTGNNVTLTQSVFSMNTMTVRAALLNVSVSATPSLQNIVAGAQNFVFANIQLDAGQSGEDLRIANLPVKIAASVISNLSSCRIYDGSTSLTTGSNVLNPTAAATTFTFDNSITVAKGTVKMLAVQCNLSSNALAAETYQIGQFAPASTTMNVTGVTSSNTVTPTGIAQNGQVMTVQTSSLVVSLDSTSPSATLAAGGTTGVTLGSYKFRATNDAVQLQQVGLILTSGTNSDLGQVYLYQGSTLIGTAIFTGGVGSIALSNLTSPITLAKDIDTVITVKGDLAGVGPSQSGTSGDVIKIDINVAGTNTHGIGVGSGSAVNASGSTLVSGVTLFRSFPTVAQDTLATTGVADGNLLRFKVTANSAGSIGINQLGFTLTWTGPTVTNTRLYAYSDANYSIPVSGVYGPTNDGQVGAAATPVSGTLFKIAATTNPVQVSAGQTVYFALKTTISGVTTGASMVAIANGDSVVAAPAVFTAGVGNFVWATNKLGTSATTDSDWVNGTNVLGLPSAGITQARGL